MLNFNVGECVRGTRYRMVILPKLTLRRVVSETVSRVKSLHTRTCWSVILNMRFCKYILTNSLMNALL